MSFTVQHVDVNGVKIPYIIQGNGTPCIVTGDLNANRNIFRRRLKDTFKFIFMELRFIENYEPPIDLEGVTMDTVIDDIEEVRKATGHEKVAVMGHSVCGLYALEYARKYPQNTSHVIMIASPPYYHRTRYWEEKDKYWENNASEERKSVLKENLDELERIKDTLSPEELSLRTSAAYDPEAFYDPRYDSMWILVGWRLNENYIHYLNMMFDDYVFPSENEVMAPVLLCQGRHDFRCPYPWWDDYEGRIPNLTSQMFEKSSHYPHLEEPELFDKLLVDWIKTN